MFRVICIKEVESGRSLSRRPSIVKVGEVYTVVKLHNDPLFGEFYILAEDEPTQCYAPELFARCSDIDERDLLNERYLEEVKRLDRQYEAIPSIL